jgi:hypothetical protein
VKNKRNWVVGICILAVFEIFLYAYGCSGGKHYDTPKFQVGEIVCFTVNKAMKGQVIAARLQSSGWNINNYYVRYTSPSAQTNTHLLGPDGDITSRTLTRDWFAEYELCDCDP